MSFKKIAFGKSSAEKELPKLLIEGFLDNGYVDKLINSDDFLVLGPKGSGKSAIGVRLELMSRSNNEIQVKKYDLADFPYKPFSKIIPSKEAREIKFQNDWEYILLVALINNILKDETALHDNPLLKKVAAALESYGILPSEDLTHIVSTTVNKKAGIKAYIFDALGSSEKEKIPFDISMLFETLKSLCYSLKLRTKNLIVIDGLDNVLTLDQKDRQYTSLGALILVADRINTRLKKAEINAKFIILCRTELFEKLPGSNNNKIKQDSAIILNWYQDKDINSTNLLNLINLRAKNSLGKPTDVFEEFFPKTITRHNKNTLPFLLNYTRHTPRDLIILLNKIQESTKGDIPSEREIWNGLDEYSTSYFISEIRDELDGFITMEEIDSTVKLLQLMRVTRFYKSDIEDKSNSHRGFIAFDLDKILDLLFNCNAIGNVDENSYHSLKYRNIHSHFMGDQKIVVHKGLWKALNLKPSND